MTHQLGTPPPTSFALRSEAKWERGWDDVDVVSWRVGSPALMAGCLAGARLAGPVCLLTGRHGPHCTVCMNI